MHLGRFHRAIELLHLDYKKLNPVQLIQDIVNALNNVSANPGNVDFANMYKTSLDNCRNTLATSPLNTPRPILENMLESINAQQFVGNALFERVRAAISANPAAPSLASQALLKIQQDAETFFQHIANVDTAFTQLRVEYETLESGEAEIGLLIPRIEGSSSLKDLSKEFNQWHNALSPIAEIFDPTTPQLQIKICATTDWMIYLASTPPVLWGLSKCVKGVNIILKDLIETRALIEKNRSSTAIDALKIEQEDEAKSKFRELADSTVEENYKGTDQARKNELKTALTLSLSTIAEKITNGAKIEVKMLPPAEKDSAEVDEHNQEETNIEFDKLKQLAKALDDEIDELSFSGETSVIKVLLEQLDKPLEIPSL